MEIRQRKRGNKIYQQEYITSSNDTLTISIADPMRLPRGYVRYINKEQKADKTIKKAEIFIKVIAFSRDGKKFMTASNRENAVKIWDIVSQKVQKILIGHSDAITSIAFSPNGEKAITGSLDNTTKLWDVATGKVEKTFAGHSDVVNAVAFSPDGKKIVTGSSDRTAKLWDIDGAVAEKTFIGHLSDIKAIAISPNGKKLLTGSSDNTAKLWDIKTGGFEDQLYSFSLYEMVEAGLKIEASDTPQYIKDSTAYVDNINYNELQYKNRIDKWSKSESVKQHQTKIDIWRNSDGAKQHKALIDSLRKPILLANYIDIRRQDSLNVAEGEKRLKNTPQDSVKQVKWMKWSLANSYNSFGFRQLLTGQFKEAEHSILRGIELDSTVAILYTNLAPALLLQGKRFKDAYAEYMRLKDKPYGIDTYTRSFLSDFRAFEQVGIIPKEREEEVAIIKKLLEPKKDIKD
jgi:WD40 repeat protein